MKHFKLIAFALTIALAFSSCTTNETLIEEQAIEQPLLKSYTVKRDLNGAYSLDYNTSENATSETVKDLKANNNEIYLYSSENNLKNYYTEDVAVTKGELNIGFVDTNSDNQPKITIFDDDISFAKGKGKDEMLKNYSITRNEDNTYDLDFKVKKKVDVDFVYNEEDEIYEIHLEKGKGDQKTFAATFTKEENKDLKIDFVNHYKTASKGYASKESAAKKPRVIIVN